MVRVRLLLMVIVIAGNEKEFIIRQALQRALHNRPVESCQQSYE